MAQGIALAHVGRYSESEKYLAEAENLAETNQPKLLGEVALRKGSSALLRDDLTEAQREYLRALKSARDLHDSYLEAACLSNLGLIATNQEHYDESIEWNRQALLTSQANGARGATAVILGNMGWGYVKLGDYDNALALFQRADKESGETGSLSAQVDWKINIGSVYLALGNYDSAESSYQSALGIAQRLGDNGAKSECFENLALVSLARGQVDSAQSYNESVAPLVRAHSDAVVSSIVSGRIQTLKKNYGDAGKIFQSVIGDADAPASLRWEAQSRLAGVYASEGKRTAADREFRRAIGTIASARSEVKNEELRLAFLSNAIDFTRNILNS